MAEMVFVKGEDGNGKGADDGVAIEQMFVLLREEEVYFVEEGVVYCDEGGQLFVVVST